MSKYRSDLTTGAVFPASFVSALQEFTGTLAANLRLTVTAANTITATASTGSDQAAVGVQGLYRYRSTNASFTVSGLSAGTYTIYVAVSDNDLSNDANTDYNWYLIHSGAMPSTVNSKAIVAQRTVGTFDWSGTAITNLRQTVGAGDTTLPTQPTASTASVVPLNVRGATSQTADLLQIGSSASANDRLTVNSAGQLTLPVTGSTGGLLIGGDTALYRSAADTLYTPDNLTVNLALSVNGTLSATGLVSFVNAQTTGTLSVGSTLGVTGAVSLAQTTVQTPNISTLPLQVNAFSASQSTNLVQVGTSSAATTNRLVLTSAGQLQIPQGASTAGLLIGADTQLYRDSADVLRTPDSLIVDSALTVSGATSVAALTASGTASLAAVNASGVITASNVGTHSIAGTLNLTNVYASGSAKLAASGGTLGFFGATPTNIKTGYGSGVAIGTKGALSSSSTLNDVIAVVSSLVVDLRAYGLIGS